VASHPGARDETVDLAAAIAGPGQSQTVDLTTAREGGTPGATVIDRRSALLPNIQAPAAPRSRRRAYVVGGLVFVAAVGAAGGLLASGGEDAAARASLAGASVELPAGWTGAVAVADEAATAAFGGLSVGTAAEMTSGPMGTGTATIVAAPLRRGASLVPARSEPRLRLNVDGGLAESWELKGLGRGRGGFVLVVPSPTGGGTAIGCTWTQSDGPGRTQCLDAWRTVRTEGDGVSESDARTSDAAVIKALTPLATRRAALPSRGEARRAESRRRAATYRRVATTLRAPATWNGDARAAARASADVSHAYDALATAAIRRDRAGDARARRRLIAADASLRRAAAALRAGPASASVPAIRAARATTLTIPRKRKAPAASTAAPATAAPAPTTAPAPVVVAPSSGSSSSGASSSRPKAKKPKVVVIDPSATE
jgi:hypothetical protein